MSTRVQIIFDQTISSGRVEYRADINDDQYSGDIEERCVTNNFFEWTYDKIDERDPFANPLQKSSFTADLRINDSAELGLLEDILDADEQRFSIDFYIDGEHKWSGNVLTDLLEYPESPFPFTAKITAKDFSILEGKTPDLGLISGRTRLSEILAACFQETGFDFPIRSYTNVTNTEVTESEDFLFTLWHENRAFYEDVNQMSCDEVLEYICRAYNLIIRQSDTIWIIEQLPAVAKGDDVQFDYDSDGLNPVSSTPDRTVDVDCVDSFLLRTSTNKITGALKTIESSYNHKTPILNIPTEDVEYESDPFGNTDEFSLSFENEGIFSFGGHIEAEAVLSDNNPAGSIVEAYFRVRGEIEGADDIYMDNSGSFSTTEQEVSITLTGSDETVTGDFDMDISDSIGSSVSTIHVEFLFAEMVDDTGAGVDVEETYYYNINTYIFQTAQSIKDENATIGHRYTRVGNYSVNEEIPPTVIGSGPTPGSVGSAYSDEFGADTGLESGFIIRDETSGVSLEELTLRERVSMRRNALRNIRANLWMKYSPESLINYEGDTWFFLGGRFVAKNSKWDANILRLAYERDDMNDSFTSFVEEGGASRGTTSTGTSTGGGGISQGAADARYFKQNSNLSEGDPATIRSNIDVYSTTEADNLFLSESEADDLYLEEANNLSDLTSITTAQDNLGLTDGSADLSFFTLSVTDAFSANSVRPDTGRFLAPVDYKFRNAGDTDFRAVEMAGLTATQAALGNITEDRVLLAGASGLVEDSSDLTFDGTTLDVGGTLTLGPVGSEGTRTLQVYDGIEFGERGAVWPTMDRAVGGGLNIGTNDNSALFLFDANGTFEAESIEISDNGSSDRLRLIREDQSGGDWGFWMGGVGHLNITNNHDSRTPLSIFRGATDGMVVMDEDGVNINGTLTGVDAEFSSTLNVGGIATFENSVAWTTPTFDTGFLGNGSRVYEEASEYHFETDVGFFRSALFANEFIINQILATQGSRIAGPGRGKIEAVIDDSSGSEVVEVSDPEGNEYAAFAENDLILCLQVRNDLDIGTTNVLEDSGGVIVKRYVRKVDSLSSNELSLSTPADAPSDAAGPAQGDVIVAFGNTTDTTRQNLLYETVIEPNAPYTVLKQGIDSWTAFKAAGNIRMKYGDLNQSYGYTSSIFGLAVGPPSGDHATFDPANGVRFIDGSGTVGAQFNSSVLTLGTGSNIVEFDVSAGTGNINLERFLLNSPELSIVDTTQTSVDGHITVRNPNDSSQQSGLLGTSGSGQVSIWSGAARGNADTAPVRIYNDGDFHFGGSSSDFLDSSGGVLTADFNDISFSSTTFSLSTTGLDIDSSIPRIDIGNSHFLDGSTDTASFSGGILVASAGSIDAAGWEIDNSWIRKVDGNDVINIMSDGTALSGNFDSGKPTIDIVENNHNFRANVGDIYGQEGETGFALLSDYTGSQTVLFQTSVNRTSGDITAQIAGFSFNATQLESTNLSGGGDGSFTSDGILINSGGYISAPNFYIDSGGDGALGDLEVSGTLSVPGGDVFIGAEVYDSPGLGLQDGILTASGLISDQGFDIDSRSPTGGQIEFHDTDQVDDLVSNSNIVGELQVNFDDSNEISTFLIRAQTVGAGWESEITFNATNLNINTDTINTTAAWEQPVVKDASVSLDLSSGEEILIVSNPVVIVNNASSDTRIARIDTPSWTPIDGQEITVINNAGAGTGVNFGWRDQTQASLSGANIRANSSSDYDHRHRTRMTLTYYDGVYYVNNDHGA